MRTADLISASWLGVTLALVVTAACASSASALTVSPAGTLTFAASGSTVIGLGSTSQRLTCVANSLGFVTNSAGSGSSSPGSASFRTCTLPVLGSVILTQSSAWTVNFALSGAVLIDLQVTIPARGLRVSSGGGCSFTLSGTVVFRRAYSTLPVTVAVTDLFPVQSSALVVDSVSACSPLVATLNLGGTWSESGSFTSGLTII